MGYHMLGLRGALVSALGTALPPLVIIVCITAFYDMLRQSPAAANALRGVRACAAALVASVSLSLLMNLLKKRDYFLMAVCAVAAVAVLFFHMKVLLLLVAGVLISPLYILLINRRGKAESDHAD